MLQRLMSRRSFLLGVVGVVMSTMLSLWGCGGGGGTSSYSIDATTTKTASALIEKETLNQWITEGKVNAPFGSTDRVVILTVGDSANYVAGHIPGSVFLDKNALNQTRIDGVGTISNMVPSGTNVDNILQNAGIDKYTTIVLVAHKSTVTPANANNYYTGRAYYVLRYWGIPKERIKMLNGGTDAYATAYTLDTASVSVSPSTFSVKNLYKGSLANFSFKTSIGQMISLVRNWTSSSTYNIFDCRGPTSWKTAHLTGSIAVDATYLVTGTTFKSVSDIRAYFAGIAPHYDTNSSNIVHCASGTSATPTFFVLDGILNLPVSLYDGSFNEWSSYYSTAAAGSVVPTIWQTNLLTTGTISPPTTAPLPFTYNSTLGGLYTTITNPGANNIYNEDSAYFMNGASQSSTLAGTGGGC